MITSANLIANGGATVDVDVDMTASDDLLMGRDYVDVRESKKKTKSFRHVFFSLPILIHN